MRGEVFFAFFALATASAASCRGEGFGSGVGFFARARIFALVEAAVGEDEEAPALADEVFALA